MAQLTQVSASLRLDLGASLENVRKQLLAEVQAQSAVMLGMNAMFNYGQVYSASYYTLLGSIPERIRHVMDEARKIATSQSVLQSLLFEEIGQREEQIHPAYAKTFD